MGIVITLVMSYWLHFIIFKTTRRISVSPMLMKTITVGYGHTEPYSIVAITVTSHKYYIM